MRSWRLMRTPIQSIQSDVFQISNILAGVRWFWELKWRFSPFLDALEPQITSEVHFGSTFVHFVLQNTRKLPSKFPNGRYLKRLRPIRARHSEPYSEFQRVPKLLPRYPMLQVFLERSERKIFPDRTINREENRRIKRNPYTLQKPIWERSKSVFWWYLELKSGFPTHSGSLERWNHIWSAFQCFRKCFLGS